jgi:hypothetical protein
MRVSREWNLCPVHILTTWTMDELIDAWDVLDMEDELDYKQALKAQQNTKG